MQKRYVRPVGLLAPMCSTRRCSRIRTWSRPTKSKGEWSVVFAFCAYPLFLASSVFVKKPERIMALSFIMVLCLLIYRLAELRLRARLAETQQTIPDQVHKPTARPTMRWVFQCFEGIERLHINILLFLIHAGQ